MHYDLTMCGWRVSSDIDLKEVPAWTGDPEAPVDIHIRFGQVPEKLDDIHLQYVLADVGTNGDYLLKFEGIGRYLVQNGNSITVHPECPPDTPDLRLLVQTSCLGAIAWQRGYIPFHGSCVKIGDQTIGIIGVSGGGKSTLAMTLVQRGHQFLTEENIITYENGQDKDNIYVLPTFPDIRLWKDALDELNIETATLLHNREGQEKYHCPVPAAFEAMPQPLSGLIVLSQNYTNPGGVVTHRPLHGADGVGRLAKFVLRLGVGGALGQSGSVLQRCVKLVSNQCAYTVISQKGVQHIHEIADTIEKIAAELPERHT